MTKYPIKRYFILFSLLCFMTYSSSMVFARPITPTNIDQTIEDSYTAIVNIQKQLATLLKEYFHHLVDDTVSKPSTASLNIYSSQLNELSPKLKAIVDSNPEESQRIRAEILISTIEYLKPAIKDMDTLLKSSDFNRQYTLFRSIIYLDTLINEVLAYF